MKQFKQSIGNPINISLDDTCNLISIELVQDELGQFTRIEKPFVVFCSKLSITRSEFHSSGMLGRKPEMLLIVDADSYNNESILEYGSKQYEIYKTFQRRDGFMELYCEPVKV